MKIHRRTESNFSTNSNTPWTTLSQSHHINPISPVVVKEKLRLRCKQQPPKPARDKTTRKQRWEMWQNQVQHKSKVNWVIYNMLVGIYHNWLRLAPYILYRLSSSRSAQIDDIEKMIRNVIKDKEYILEMLKKYKTRNSIELKDGQQGNQNQLEIDEQLLEKIFKICNEVKVSTQIFNGQILAKKRVVKTQKENILANQVIQEISKSANLNLNEVKMKLLGDQVSKVAQSIVDRIAIVKYMKKNKIKIDESILKPLRAIFQSQKNFDYDQSITTAKVIQKIKSKFAGNSIHNSKVREFHTRQNFVQGIGKKQQESKVNQNQQLQLRISTLIPDSQKQQDVFSDKIFEKNEAFDNWRFRSKKKIGFIEQDEEWQRKIRDSYNGDKIKKKNQEIYNQRKVILNRELKRTKVKAILSNLKNQFQSKNEQIQMENKSTNLDQIIPGQKLEQKIKKNEKTNRKTDRIGKNVSQKWKQLPLKNPQKSLSKVGQNNNQLTNRFLKENDESDSQVSSQSNPNQKISINRSRKFLKPARLLRKKKLKKSTNLFDKINLENFDLELRAEQNVLNKKRKILNLFNSLQASGLITTKSIKKIVSNVKKVNFQLNSQTGRNHIKRAKAGVDYPITSFFMIPLQEEKEIEEKTDQCLPYSFLTRFTKEAVLNWRHKKQEADEWKQFTMQKCRFLGMDYDLDTFIMSNQGKITEKQFDKEQIALEMGLCLVRKFDQSTIQQKGVHTERQSSWI